MPNLLPLTHVCAILRHNGVSIDKRDYRYAHAARALSATRDRQAI